MSERRYYWLMMSQWNQYGHPLVTSERLSEKRLESYPWLQPIAESTDRDELVRLQQMIEEAVR